jgi:hypothetical protein
MPEDTTIEKSSSVSIGPKSNHRLFIVLLLLIIIASVGFFLFKKHMPQKNMNTSENTTETAHTGLLEKSNPISELLIARAATDLHEKALKSLQYLDTISNTITSEKWAKANAKEKEEAGATLKKAVLEYMQKTHSTIFVRMYAAFLQNLQYIGKDDIAKIEGELKNQYDLRVTNIGNNEYVVTFWYDTWIDNHATTDAENGNNPRYVEMLSLLYAVSPDNQITLHDPLQPLYDFLATL